MIDDFALHWIGVDESLYLNENTKFFVECIWIPENKNITRNRLYKLYDTKWSEDYEWSKEKKDVVILAKIKDDNNKFIWVNLKCLSFNFERHMNMNRNEKLKKILK